MAEPPGPSAGIAGARGLAGGAILISVLQAWFFVAAAPDTSAQLLAGALAALTIASAWRGLRRTAPISVSWLRALLATQALALAAHAAAVIDPPSSGRSALAALLCSYAAVAAAGLLGATRLTRFPEALLACFSIACGFLLIDAVSQWSIGHANGIRWMGVSEPHAYLGYVYRPYSEGISYFPDDPRGYFERLDAAHSFWNLGTHQGADARLELLESGGRRSVRARITSGDVFEPWQVQLTRFGVRVEARRRYALRFRARASRPAGIRYSLREPRPPWQPMGLQGEAELGEDWRSFGAEFTASAGDPDGRLQFDVGGAHNAVELADVSVRRLPGGDPAWPEAPAHVVRYRFNALGCRGSDYEIPRPASASRILMLGDSFVMGMGVHEPDTLSVRLEARLNQTGSKGGGKYEVVNCGHSGYSTRDERRFYETVGVRYQAPLVLLGMVENDDVSALDEAEQRRRAWLWRSFALSWFVPRNPDFRESVLDVKRLNDACRRHGARLLVFLFRNARRAGSWKELARQVDAGLAGTGIPVLDVGDALLREHRPHALKVHTWDWHPNEIANRLAADELLRLLERERLY